MLPPLGPVIVPLNIVVFAVPSVRFFPPSATVLPATPLKSAIVIPLALSPLISNTVPLVFKLTKLEGKVGDPLSAKVPPLMRVEPVYVFMPSRVRDPLPAFVRELDAVPLIAPVNIAVTPESVVIVLGELRI